VLRRSNASRETARIVPLQQRLERLNPLLNEALPDLRAVDPISLELLA
jgi:hypothetical protein